MASHGTALPPVKNVTVYRNGDPFFPGRRFVVNHKQVANLESFLNDVTQSIQAPAAVRTLYTPREGHRVHELEDLRSGAQYVAAGFERFKKIDYLNTGLKPVMNRSEKAQGRTVYRPNVSAKWRKAIHLPCIIHVFRNGDLLCPPFRFIIPRNMLQDLGQILSMVTEKASLRTGAVRRLCALDGGAITAGEELETGQYYVAVGTERFKKLPYVELLVPKAPVGHNLRNQYGNRRLPKRYETRKPVSVPQDRYSDSALLDSPESDGRRVKSTGDEAGVAAPTQGIRTKQGRLPKEEASLFYAKPVKVGKNRTAARPALPLRGATHPNVFKGEHRKRREEVQGAQEVAEDENTLVELPVDQRVAETVEDEELNERDHFESPRSNLNLNHVESPRDDLNMSHTRENPSQDPEVGYITNGNASANSRENSDRPSSLAGTERQEELRPPELRPGFSRTSSLQDLREDPLSRTHVTSSLEQEEPKRAESMAGSITYRSPRDSLEVEQIRPASHVSVKELAA